jgi:photosystem II stability/assembly factor-like uncharacterized protein/dienelactone hydrolase
MKKILYPFVFIFVSTLSFSQPLARKYWNGFRITPITDSIKKLTNTKDKGLVYINKIMPQGSAAAAKLIDNDILLSVNGITITKRADLVSDKLSTLKEGEDITYTIIRNGKELSLKAKAKGREKENSAELDYEYASVNYDNGKLGAIYSFPKNKPTKLPAVLFVQGYTCADVVDLDDKQPYRRLCDDISKNGFVVMRVEKPGMGNSINTPACDNIDYNQEFKAFENALIQLKKHPNVDTNNIFIWGHSLGGIIAPGLTAKHQWVKGTAVYGTLQRIWGEYILNMTRLQGMGFGTDPIELEKHVRAARIILHETHVNKKSMALLVKEQPDLASYLKEDFSWDGSTEKMYTRSLSYFQSLDDVNTVLNWSKTSCKVLAFYGEADLEALNPEGAKEIEHIVNTYHPGNGKYYFMPQTDHVFAKVGTIEDGYKAKAKPNYYDIMLQNYNSDIAKVTVGWMQHVINPNINLDKSIKKNLNPYQWEKLNTEKYKGKQDDIFFSDVNNGWYGNGDGKIYKTTNSGKTWNVCYDKKGFFVRCLGFIDSLHGFAGNVGTDYFPGVTDTTCMLETMDGGKNWKEVTNIKGPYPKGLCAIDVYKKMFINAGKPAYKTTLRAAGRVGSPAFMMTSFDEGKTWMSEDMSKHTKMIFDINVGFICGGTDADTEKSHALIIKTTDGGKTWKKVYESNRPFELTWKCSFPTDKVGYVTLQSYNPDASTNQRYIIKTQDGGDTWQELPFVKDITVREFGVGFIDENTGFVGTTTGGYQTTDGGKNWAKTDFGLYTNKFRLLNTLTGKRVIAIGSELFTLDVETKK